MGKGKEDMGTGTAHRTSLRCNELNLYNNWHRLLPMHVVATYTQDMTNEDSALDGVQDSTREAGQRLRASLNLVRSRGMLDDSNFRELVTRLSTALAMTEAAYLETRRRREIQ